MNEINIESLSNEEDSMKIQIRNVPEKISRELILEAVNFYLLKLPFKKPFKSKISIDFVQDLYKKEKYIAYVCPDKPTRSYQIKIDPKISKWKIIETLAHELAHIKQYKNKELSEYDVGGMTTWRGRKYADGSKDDEEYYSRKWEHDAYGLEVCMSRLFRIHLQKRKK